MAKYARIPAWLGLPFSLVLLLAPGIGAAVEPAHARAAFNEAVSLYKSGRMKEARSAFESLAASGDPRGEFALAVMSEHGQGVEKDAGIARARYRRAAEAGYVKAQLNLALMLEAEGSSRRPALSEAVRWFGEAAARGNRDALARLQALADGGNAEARAGLGRLYLTGSGVTKDPGMAVGLLESAAAEGVADAAYNLGVMYELGIGVARNPRGAAVWYRDAARATDPAAAYNLGLLLARAPELMEEFGSPEPWLAEAAADGNGEAAMALALWLERQQPLSVPDAARVLSLYQDAARAGVATAQVNLAFLLANPNADDAQLELAYAWTTLAVRAGNPVAEANLARMDAFLADSARERARAKAGQLLASP